MMKIVVHHILHPRNAIVVFLFLFSSVSFAQQWRLAEGTGGNPIAAISIYRSDPDTMYALGAGYQLGPGFLRSTNGGHSWDSIAAYGSDIGALKVDPYDSKLLYASVFGHDIESNDVIMSTDGGLTWKVLLIGVIAPAPVVEIDPRDNRTVYVGRGPGLIFRSTNQGATWDTITKPPAAYQAAQLTSLVIAASNDSILYAGYRIAIYKSTDKGNTWQTLNLGFGIHSQTLLTVDPRSADTVYAAVFPSPQSPSYSGGVYKSTDGGQTWFEANNGLRNQDKQIMSIAINPKDPDQLFLGTYERGVQNKLFFQTTNGGNEWTDFSDGLPDTGVARCIAIDTVRGKIFSGINGGLYVRDVITDVVTQKTDVPKDFHLSQNYPNPFNPSTIINYDVPEYSHVKIVVYDILGREVRTLIDEKKPTGCHTAVFNASHLSSGVYLYQLRAGSTVMTMKMILLR